MKLCFSSWIWYNYKKLHVLQFCLSGILIKLECRSCFFTLDLSEMWISIVNYLVVGTVFSLSYYIVAKLNVLENFWGFNNITQHFDFLNSTLNPWNMDPYKNRWSTCLDDRSINLFPIKFTVQGFRACGTPKWQLFRYMCIYLNLETLELLKIKGLASWIEDQNISFNNYLKISFQNRVLSIIALS